MHDTGTSSIVYDWKLQYSSSSNTGNTSIVKHTILETLVSGNLTEWAELNSNNTGNTSIADTGKFWKILVISVLQILEYSGKYW
jgi:hypothetical protein